MIPDSAITQFFFGTQHWHEVLGWHVAVFIALCIGYYIAYKIHRKKL